MVKRNPLSLEGNSQHRSLPLSQPNQKKGVINICGPFRWVEHGHFIAQPAEGGQGREVCVEQTTDQERDQPAYGAIMATDQPMSSGEGLTAYYPQTQGELQPVLGGFTSKGSQDGVGVSSCRTHGRPQDDTSPREADAKPRKTDRQTIPPPNQLREQPELYCRGVIEKTTITGHRVSIQIPN